jgi:hypothetical protein
MLIGNPLNNLSVLQSPASDQKQSQKQAQQDLERPSQEQQARVPVQELMRLGEVKQVERLEALDRTENLSLKSKEAIQQYQETEEASRSFGGGELLGIDVYV